MLSPRDTTQRSRFNRPGTVACAGLLMIISGCIMSGCSRNATPVAPQSGVPQTGASGPQLGMNGNGETPVKVNTLPKRSVKTSPKAPTKPTRIVWEKSFEAALAKAKTSGKPVMIDFYTVWCGYCKVLDEETYTAPEVIAESANFVSVKVDAEKRPDLERRYQVSGYPTIIITDSDGQAIEVLPSFAPADQFVEFMRSGLAKHMTAVVT